MDRNDSVNAGYIKKLMQKTSRENDAVKMKLKMAAEKLGNLGSSALILERCQKNYPTAKMTSKKS